MYLVVGGNGFLGNYVIKSILEQTEEKIIATARNVDELVNTERLHWEKCGIEDEQSFDELITKIKQTKDLKVVFLAACHHPDFVAENPQVAWNINVTALSRCINKLYMAQKLFYASTDSVYGNSINGYHFKESDSLNPVNTYGKNKAAAEAIIYNYGFNVVRFPFLIATSLVKNKPHFYDWIAEGLKAGREVEMFGDSYRSSLNFKTAADLLIQLCESTSNVPGLLNVCGDKDLSKYDIGLMIADKVQANRALVKKVNLENNTDIFKTQRALSTLMDNSKVKEFLHLDSIDFVI